MKIKTNISRIFVMILALAMLFSQAAAAKSIPLIFPDGIPEATEESSPEADAEYFDPELNGSEFPEEEIQDESVRYDENVKDGSQAGYKPNYYDYISHYNYDAFEEIAELYQSTHLYNFTTEELYDAFLRKLLADNPYLFKMFLSTLLSTMDKYSNYYDSDSGFLDSTGTYYGITMGDPDELERKKLGFGEKKGTYIISVIPGSGADTAGVKVGDRIVAIGDFDVEGLPYNVVNTLLRYYPFTPKVDEEKPVTLETFRQILNGKITDTQTISLAVEYLTSILADAKLAEEQAAQQPTQSPDSAPQDAAQATPTVNPLVLTLERGGERVTLSMVKSSVQVSQVSVDYDFELKIATLTISSFGAHGVAEETRQALEQIRKLGIRNIIIDLRSNGGGYIDEAVAMADLFVEKENEVYCYLNSRTMEKPEPILSAGTGKDYGDIVILVGPATASASELFSMILRDHVGAFLIGTTTYGKAVGQSAYYLMNGDMITVTDSEILTPGLRSYNDIGLSPNLEIDILEMRYKFPEELKKLELTYDAYLSIKPGEYSTAALAFEKYFAFLGNMDEAFADGVFDENTTRAINAYLLLNERVADGILTEADIKKLSNSVNKYRAYFYNMDTQYEVATFYFRSFSQAKRRVKELVNESKKAVAEKREIERIYVEQMRAEEKAEQEAQKQAEAQQSQEQTNEITPETQQAKQP